jgi:hypothetical protein
MNRVFVAQVGNLSIPKAFGAVSLTGNRRGLEVPGVCGLAIRDTADWQSALRAQADPVRFRASMRTVQSVFF